MSVYLNKCYWFCLYTATQAFEINQSFEKHKVLK